MKKKNNKKNTRKVNKKENGLKQKILEINLSKATVVTSTIVIIAIIIITAGLITTIAESNKDKAQVEQEEEYSPVNWIESTEIGEDGNYKKVPVPKGYVASQIEGETTVNGGFVIYEDNYNGKSINWDEIIIKDDSSNTNTVNVDDDKKENSTEAEKPEVIPTEDEPEDEAETTLTNVQNEEEQAEQEEITGNDESFANEEKPVENEEGQEETRSPEKDVVSEENVQEESGVVLQADEIESTEGEGDTTEPTEPETPTAEQQTKKNIFDLQKSVNQYVWVRVPDISRVCGVDANGKLWGKLYSFTASGATSAYNSSWTETDGIMRVSSKTTNREPDVTHSNTDYDRDRYLKSRLYGETQYEMLAEEIEQNFYETMKSIEKYGGYYIGRYETGSLSSTGGSGVVRKMNTSISNITWYQMYKGCKALAGSNENVKTSMIWGSLWDETLKWLVESGAKTSTGSTITYSLINGSTAWGNYRDAIFNYIPAGAEGPEETETKAWGGMKIPTGSAEYTKANNIYDMAGNIQEWTLEDYVTVSRIERGSCYTSSMRNTMHASYRDSTDPTNSKVYCGCRSVLIIR